MIDWVARVSQPDRGAEAKRRARRWVFSPGPRPGLFQSPTRVLPSLPIHKKEGGKNAPNHHVNVIYSSLLVIPPLNYRTEIID